MSDTHNKPAGEPRESLLVRAAKSLEGREQDVVLVATAFILGAIFTASVVAEVTPHSKEHDQ